MCPILEYIDNDMVSAMMSKLIPMLDFKSHTTSDVTEQVSRLFGEVTYKLHQRGLLMEHAKSFIAFYKDMLADKSHAITEIAIFCLPCMHSNFRDMQEQYEISFFSLYKNLVTLNGEDALKLKAI